MTVKGIVRFFIGFVIALVILAFALPQIHIPRAQMIPSPMAYSSAKGTAKGTIGLKKIIPTSNWFKTGELVYVIEYKFPAPAPEILGDSRKGTASYAGTISLDEAKYNALKVGDTVPIRYEKTYPEINGVDAPWGGRSGVGASRGVSGWVLWIILALALGWMISPLIERVALRESY